MGATGNEQAGNERAGAVDAALATLRDGASHAEFARALFAHVPMDDLRALAPAVLGETAAAVHDAVRDNEGGTDVTVCDLDAERGRDRYTLVAVVTPDKPFVVDSALAEIREHGVAPLLVAHPVGERSCFVAVLPRLRATAALREGLEAVMSDVERATGDWHAMLQTVEAHVEALRRQPPPVPADELGEAVQFLQWLVDGNFTFLGLRSYAFRPSEGGDDLRADGEVALGILHDLDRQVMTRGGKRVAVTPAIRAFLDGPAPLFVSKANLRSTVHRRAYLDYVGIKRYDDEGRVRGELRLVGLFTSTAYNKAVATIPLMRLKARQLMDRWETKRGGHSAKALENVIEGWPRDEFFQASVERLQEHTRAAVALEERPRVRVLVRPDRFDRFVTCLVYVPREAYDTRARIRIGELLSRAYDGHVSAWYPDFLENGLVRVHYVLGRDEGHTPDVDPADLEEGVREIVRSWSDRLAAVAGEAGLAPAAFPVGYQDEHTPEEALRDLPHVHAVATAPTAEGVAGSAGKGALAAAFALEPLHDGGKRAARLKLFHAREPLALSIRVPMLENMGFSAIEESTFAVETETLPVFQHDMTLLAAQARTRDPAALEEELSDTLGAVWRDRVADDPFNALVLSAGYTWREASVFRLFALYLRQLRSRFTPSSMARTLARYPLIAEALLSAFHARFDPERTDHAARFEREAEAVETLLADVASPDDDRILRNFLHCLRAALRTNFWQPALWDPTEAREGAPAPVLAFKFDPALLPLAPKPVPYREIFVSSPLVEGLHLRFGPVARGGLRWTDRAQDYRTEVLGLVKAQQVKNAVIVPVGSKGGFLPKRLPSRAGDPDGWFEAGREAYRVYISSMLSLTDNLRDDAVVPPPRTVRHDGDDPYFVVAADKGTATFSDTANAISRAYGFWLDDAFASGGSAGYDHKAMGITARGAWEAVRRHFREMPSPSGAPAWDIQSEPFTAAGVGDMSGDVFGNGMLLSRQTKLIAAFDHRDIFIDPNPDPATSYEERERLFALERSSWADYDRAKLSPGGMVASRGAKEIELTPEAAAAIAMAPGAHPPADVMRAILKAPVDLMWFGGIGTYVRATTETDADAGDRANDAIRITAAELGAKVVGEGANLGMTQPARIEFNRLGSKGGGGRANSDAIDNSGGVNSSDLEVNIKIALARALRDGRLDLPSRNRLLESMTDEVAALVLRNNYEQTLAISLTERAGTAELPHQARLMQELEARDLLDRAVEDLPDEAALAERQTGGEALTRAEIGVILAYAKIVAFDDLVTAQGVSGVLDDPWFERELMAYFPDRMEADHADDIRAHRLRHEIIATRLANAMINEGGPSFVSKCQARTQAGIGEIARAFAVARAVLGLEALEREIDALDARIAGDVQLELYAVLRLRLLEGTLWFLRNTERRGPVGARAERFGAAVDALRAGLEGRAPQYLAERVSRDRERLGAHGVPDEVAHAVALTQLTVLAPDIALVAAEADVSLDRAADTFFAVTKAFRVGRMVEATRTLASPDWFDTLALDQALATIGLARREIAKAVLAGEGGVVEWSRRKGPLVERSERQIASMVEQGQLSISRLSVAANLLAELARR